MLWLAPGHRRMLQRPITMAVCSVAILILIASSANASARPGYEVRPGGVKTILAVGSMGAYVISVWANESERVQVQMDGPSSRVTYSTSGHISGRGIHASFGAMGRVDVMFEVTRRRSDSPLTGRCTGLGPRYQEGNYHGEIELSSTGELPTVDTNYGRFYSKRRFRRVQAPASTSQARWNR